MFDTMTFTKALGAFCGALLVLQLGKFAAEKIYKPEVAHDDGHGGAVVQGYLIATDTGADDGAAEEAGPTLEELLASADIGKGERVFNKCKACHKLEAGENSTGPYLYGVVGRDVDVAQGFSYSGALEEVVDVWTPEHLYAFLANPAGYTPGTSMGFSGLKKSEDRANVIAFLDSIDD